MRLCVGLLACLPYRCQRGVTKHALTKINEFLVVGRLEIRQYRSEQVQQSIALWSTDFLLKAYAVKLMTCTKKETKKNILHDMFKLKEMTEKINSGLVVRFSNYV